MKYIRLPSRKTLLTGLVLAVIGLAFVVIQTSVLAHSGIVGMAEPIALPLEHTRGESELPWLFAVYIITWGAFFGYVFAMSRRQREMRREIELLRRVFEENESQAASSRPE